MPRLHTHYDNLKVSRDAPIEVIRAAYRSLAAKYHPDVHPNKEKAAHIMRVINTSYEVLSDPSKRRVHDQWILQQEAEAETEHEQEQAPNPPPPPTPPPRRPRQPAMTEPPEFYTFPDTSHSNDRLKTLIGMIGALLLVVVAIDVFVPSDSPSVAKVATTKTSPVEPSTAANETGVTTVVESQPTPTAEPPSVAAVEPARVPVSRPGEVRPAAPPVYIRPELAPDGNPWPMISGYLSGFEKLAIGGHCDLTVDNSRSDADVVVAVYDHAHDRAVRVFFLLAHDQFKAEDLLTGRYDLRYEDLRTGAISKSDLIVLTEGAEEKGHWYSATTVTLYGELNPKHPISFNKISPNEFVKLPPR